MDSKVLVGVVLASSLFIWGCNVDTARLADGGVSLMSAATISDEQLKQESRDMRAVGDKQAKVASSSSSYMKRLNNLTKNLKNEDGLDLNFKVYLTEDINANATPDGSIRVYSGLMDYMNDEELFFVIGHEIGHVANGDALDAMRVAYATAGVRQGASAVNNAAVVMSDALLGDLLEAVVNAQFSQKQESSADVYGYNLMRKYGKDPASAVSALNKLAALGPSGGFLSSHPDSSERARNIEKLIASEGK